MKFILLLIYSPLIFSLCDKGHHTPLSDFLNKMEPIVKKPWMAASEQQVEQHNCQSDIPSTEQMKDYLSSGLDLSKSLNTLINRKESFTKSEVKTDLAIYGADVCSDIICKAQKIFGETEGIELLYMHQKYGLNASHLVHDDTQPWTSKMLAPYLKGLAAVPSFMLPISKNQQFTRSNKNSNDVADALIMFYNGVDKLSSTEITYTTFHEIAHYITGKLHIEDDQDWMLASDWIEKKKVVNFKPLATIPKVRSTGDLTSSFSFKSPSVQTTSSIGLSFGKPRSNPLKVSSNFTFSTDKVKHDLEQTQKLLNGMKNTHPEKVISRYGETNPLEDIAESMVAYRFNPAGLKEISPKRYQYLKDKVFLGVEYLDNSNCDSKGSTRAEFLKLTE